MRSKNPAIFILVAFLLVISLACGISFSGDEPSEEEIRLELTRQSIQKTQTAAAEPASSDSVSDDSSSDDQSSDEADTSDSDSDDEEDGEDTCNMSKFVSETIPDGSVYQSGDTFTKSWTIRNNGTCDWTTGYRFVFEEGTQMGGLTSTTLDHTVNPGETYTFEVDLTAPAADGNYTGVWRIKSDDGEQLGKYWVMITVGLGAPASFAVTGAPLSMSEVSPIHIVCPGNKVVTISSAITTSASGVVSFKWDDSQGCLAGCVTKSINFAGAETKTIQHTMTIGAAGAYWAKIYIDAPNHQWFGPINFTVVCP